MAPSLRPNRPPSSCTPPTFSALLLFIFAFILCSVPHATFAAPAPGPEPTPSIQRPPLSRSDSNSSLVTTATTSTPTIPTSLTDANETFIPRSAIIKTSDNGTVTGVFDSSTDDSVEQSSASDGAGTGLWASAPSILWFGFCLLFGIPMALAGVRGWRITLGASIGLASGLVAWAALINTLSAPGISDMAITFIVFGFVIAGFALGVFNFMRVGAIVVLGIIGGMALGVRLVIAKEGLLISSDSLYAFNVIIPLIFGVMGGALVTGRQRIGIVTCSASVGTFLVGLGMDLILDGEDGWSRGLRYLFDRNEAHLEDTITNGYHPSLRAQIVIAFSVGLIPILAYFQHRVFKEDFHRNRPESWILEDDLADHDGTDFREWPHAENKKRSVRRGTYASRFSNFMNGPSRFSFS